MFKRVSQEICITDLRIILLTQRQMLAIAHERAKLHHDKIRSIRGVVFLGTPHSGSDVASMLSWLAKIAKVASLGHTNSKLVAALKSQGNDLLEISESFIERGEHLDKIYSFFELEKLYGSIVSTSNPESLDVDSSLGCIKRLRTDRAAKRRDDSYGLQSFNDLQIFQSRE